jgi:hypothetical protein
MSALLKLDSQRMYKSRFDRWGFGKNTTKQDWQAFVILRDRKKAAGVDLRQVQIHQRIRRLSELERFLRKQDVSEEEFLKEATESGMTVPDHVRSIPSSCNDPEQVVQVVTVCKPTEDACNKCANDSLVPLNAVQYVETSLRHTQFDRAQGSYEGSSNAFERLQLPFEQARLCSQASKRQLEDHPHHDHNQSLISILPNELSTYIEQAVNPGRGIMAPCPSFDHLSELAQLWDAPSSPREFPRSTIGIDFALGALRSSDPLVRSDLQIGQDVAKIGEVPSMGGSGHLKFYPLPVPVPGSIPDPTILYVQTAKHHALMGDVLMACMSAAAGDPSQDVDLADLWMEQAVFKLKVMCATQDPMFLFTVHMILVWLQVHDTESRTESLIGKLSDATAFQLGKTSPIAITLDYMTAAAGKKLSISGLGLGQLCGAVNELNVQLGPDHPHTLVTLYYMCFHMMRVDHRFAEAEEELRKLYGATSKILGTSSFLTVCVLATLSRAQSRQNKHHAALDTIDQCLKEAPLGLNHPHLLDLLCRKALICGHLKDKLKPTEETERQYWDKKMEELYWIVTRGRVATLGRHHKRTIEAHDTLIGILEDNGRYDLEAVKAEALELLKQPQMAVSSYESWWRSMVPKDREGETQPAPLEVTI